MSRTTSASPLERVNCGVLKGFLDAFMNLTDPRPSYTGERCLVERNAVGGCDKCMQACPHDAVRIGSSVEILEGDCTGCGLCVQACPTGALEYDLVKTLGVLKQQGTQSANVAAEERVPCSLKCSKVPGDGSTLECLGRVTPAMLLASAAWGQRLTLARGDCDTCKLGGPSVPGALENVVQIAQAYREDLNAEPMDVRIVQYGVQGSVEADDHSSSPEQVAPSVAVSRRNALQAMAQNARGGVARVIPDRILPGVDTKVEAQPVRTNGSGDARRCDPRRTRTRRSTGPHPPSTTIAFSAPCVRTSARRTPSPATARWTARTRSRSRLVLAPAATLACCPARRTR
ncbi:MAG: 4Fe-4S binding protein [Pleurocapsa sp. SU_196_0]|nr:4Fe-4S binding protein [Pleurocapsa sp. SU_196_0]